MNSLVQTIIKQLDSLNSARVDDLYFYLDGNIFSVAFNTRWLYYERITRSEFLSEIDELKKLFDRFLNVYPEFKLYLNDKQIIYKLWYTEDKSYSFTICEEKNGTIYWSPNIKEL